MKKGIIWVAIILVMFSTMGAVKPQVIRVGYFPNITHAQAVIGLGDGTFQKVLGQNVKIEKFVFNAGPSVIEAMMSGHLDLAYIGPNPAVNGYLRTNGKLLKIVAGAASGGAALVLRSDLKIKQIKQLNGLRLASPQIGNTQDVALKYFLKKNGFKLKAQGGTVQVLPIANPDQLILMQKKEIDGAWTVEPWVSRLLKEAGGTVFIDERELWPGRKFVTGNIIVSQKFLATHPDLVKKWLRAHVQLTLWINANPAAAQKALIKEIKQLTGTALPEDIIREAFTRFNLTYEPLSSSLKVSAAQAFELGFLGKKKPDLAGIYDIRLLNQVLQEEKLAVIKE